MTTETPACDLRATLVGTDGNGASWDQRTLHKAFVVFSDTVRAQTGCYSKSTEKCSLRLDKKTKLPPDMRDAPSSRHRCYLCQCSSASIKIRMRWSINRPMIETAEIFLTIGDYDDRKSADAFPFYHAQLNRWVHALRSRKNRQNVFTPWTFPN